MTTGCNATGAAAGVGDGIGVAEEPDDGKAEGVGVG
jgi:hypothetical protein